MNKLQILTGLALAIAASAQAPLPSPFQGGSSSGGGAPIAGATSNCLVDAATSATLETKTNCPTIASTGAVTFNGTTSGQISLVGATSGNAVAITVGTSTAAGTLTAPGTTGILAATANGGVTNGHLVVYGDATGGLLADGGAIPAGVTHFYTATTFTGIGHTAFTPSLTNPVYSVPETLEINDTTATTGVTTLGLVAGAATGNSWLEFYNSSHTRLAGVYSGASDIVNIGNHDASDFGDLDFRQGTASGALHVQKASNNYALYIDNAAWLIWGGPPAFAALTGYTPGAGAVIWCSDCQVTTVTSNIVSSSTCKAGGSGTFAMNVAGTWKCAYLP